MCQEVESKRTVRFDNNKIGGGEGGMERGTGGGRERGKKGREGEREGGTPGIGRGQLTAVQQKHKHYSRP